jgi:hypothetical protein
LIIGIKGKRRLDCTIKIPGILQTTYAYRGGQRLRAIEKTGIIICFGGNQNDDYNSTDNDHNGAKNDPCLIAIPELANRGFTIETVVLVRDGREGFEIDNVFLHALCHRQRHISIFSI